MIKDANILLSVINTKLRDFYSNLDDLCEDLDYDKNEVVSILENVGYSYNIELNQFIGK